MTRMVELPVWLLVLILAFAAVTALSHFLLPSVRWFFRRRMERVVAKLNERLERPIEPFKLARRHDTILRLIYDARVIEAVAEHARETGVPEDVAFQEARRYAREIVPSFSASAYFGIAIKLARWISRAFYRVRLGYFDEEALKRISPDATVIFIMNHRSNMDYVLVTYLAAERAALSYAVGEWARVWPLSRLIRAMGAYFIRRRSRNALYRRVLARYVQMATAAGVAQAVFPEGGLSLDGRVGEPKLGLLNYIVSDFVPGESRDVAFVPVGLNYDRVLEDRMLVAAGQKGNRKFRPRWRLAIRYFVKHIWQRLTGRFMKFGYAAVSFGAPLSLAEFMRARGGARGADGGGGGDRGGDRGGGGEAGRTAAELTEDIGRELMSRIREIVPVLPVPLVCETLLDCAGPVSRRDLARAVCARVRALARTNLHVRPQKDGPEEEVEVAINHLLMRRMIRERGAGLEVVDAERPLVEYYANSIAHFLEHSPERPEGPAGAAGAAGEIAAPARS